MKRQRWIVVKLHGTRCVLDLDAMAVSPCCCRRDADKIANGLEDGSLTMETLGSGSWFALMAEIQPGIEKWKKEKELASGIPLEPCAACGELCDGEWSIEDDSKNERPICTGCSSTMDPAQIRYHVAVRDSEGGEA